MPAGLDPELVTDRCWLLGATAIGELDSRLEVGFATDEAARAAAVALGEWRPSLAVAVVDAGPLLDAALEAWRPYARPVHVGRLVVRPSWLDRDDDPLHAGERLVVVDPTRAFGYDHPTTVACLEVIGRLAVEGTSVLDIGCGSGVLALAGAVLGASPVVAVDTDPVAVESTRSAAEATRVVVDASTTPVGDLEGAFDLVVANIGARPLIDLAAAVAARVAPGGRLALGGLLADQAAEVVAAYEAQGLSVETISTRDGWATPVFLRKSTTMAP